MLHACLRSCPLPSRPSWAAEADPASDLTKETPWERGSHRAAAPTPSLPRLFSWRTVSTGSVPPHLSAQSFCLLSAAPCLQPQGLEASPTLHAPTSVSDLPLTPKSTRPRPPVPCPPLDQEPLFPPYHAACRLSSKCYHRSPSSRGPGLLGPHCAQISSDPACPRVLPSRWCLPALGPRPLALLHRWVLRAPVTVQNGGSKPILSA